MHWPYNCNYPVMIMPGGQKTRSIFLNQNINREPETMTEIHWFTKDFKLLFIVFFFHNKIVTDTQ